MTTTPLSGRVARLLPNSTPLCLLISVRSPLPFPSPLHSNSVTTSLRRRQCSFRRKTMKALALSFGGPKVSHIRLRFSFLPLYTFF